MRIEEIKYRAQCKGFSKVLSSQHDMARAQKDVDENNCGGVTVEEIINIMNGAVAEYEVWKYIFSLIEKDNKL